jgi:hypothetical protein
MPELKNLVVEWLSLVDRAAVRDPSSPTEPQKFLLWKRESGEPEAEAAPEPAPDIAGLQTMVEKTNKAIKKMQRRIDALTKTNPPPADPHAEEATMPEEAVTKTEDEKSPEGLAKSLTDLSKADGGLSAAQETYRKIGADYLAALSPQAFQAWQRGQKGLRATPYPGALLKADTKPLDPDSLRVQAEELRKADPSLDPYSAMIAVMKQDKDGQAAYLRAVRGR